MTFSNRPFRRRARSLAGIVAGGCVALGLAGCGGSGGSNPLDNPPVVENPPSAGGQKLSFAYFQRCINPIFLAQLQTNVGGVVSTNTCAGSGCHDDRSGTGGAFRVVSTATAMDVTDPANTPDVIKASEMYKNFYSAQGMVLIGTPAQSRLLTKPRVQGVLHGGGVIFDDPDDPNVKLIEYWISHPAPQGQDEFAAASHNMFTPADPNTGACNTQ